jgi:hypothetical protein
LWPNTHKLVEAVDGIISKEIKILR